MAKLHHKKNPWAIDTFVLVLRILILDGCNGGDGHVHKTSVVLANCLLEGHL
jgi:hypothetical protein